MSNPRCCPRCGIGLFTGVVENTHLFACGHCGGVWLNSWEAARILRPLAVPRDRPTLPSLLRCPVCRKNMAEWTVGSTAVPLDTCAEHGTWFDRQEIEALSAAAARMWDEPEPDFSRMRASSLVAPAIAGAAAAIAVHAVARADVLIASGLDPARADVLIASGLGPARQEGESPVLETLGGLDDIANAAEGAYDLNVATAEHVGAIVEAVSAKVEAGGSLLEVLEAIASVFEIFAIF